MFFDIMVFLKVSFFIVNFSLHLNCKIDFLSF
jgi:hypothetical protein